MWEKIKLVAVYFVIGAILIYFLRLISSIDTWVINI